MGSSHKKFSGVLHHLELCGVALQQARRSVPCIMGPRRFFIKKEKTMDRNLLQEYADFAVKVGVNVQKGQTLIV